MSKYIGAHTNAGADNPGFINFTREDDGTVSVHVRGDPTKREGIYICGYARDKGQPGRCTPGDEHCNNYCNLAPIKGPMQDSPKPCSHIDAAPTVKLTLSAADFAGLKFDLTENES